MSTDVRVVLVTAPDREAGERLATTLVEERRAACANVVPGVTSVYWWEGSVQRTEEVLLVLKTRAASLAGLMARAVELHPYDVPEVLALDVEDGFPPYLAWVRHEASTSGKRA